MSDKQFNLEILTPEKCVFLGEVTSFQAPSKEGYFQILYNHTPLLAALRVGRIKIGTAQGTKIFAISGGFAEISNNKVFLLAETAEPAEEIDQARAREAKERADRILRERNAEMDVDRARLALMRAINRLSVAQKAF